MPISHGSTRARRIRIRIGQRTPHGDPASGEREIYTRAFRLINWSIFDFIQQFTWMRCSSSSFNFISSILFYSPPFPSFSPLNATVTAVAKAAGVDVLEKKLLLFLNAVHHVHNMFLQSELAPAVTHTVIGRMGGRTDCPPVLWLGQSIQSKACRSYLFPAFLCLYSDPLESLSYLECINTFHCIVYISCNQHFIHSLP